MLVPLWSWSTFRRWNTSRHLLVTYALDEKHTCGQGLQSGCKAGASRPRLSRCPCMLPPGWMNLRCPSGSQGKRHMGYDRAGFCWVSKTSQPLRGSGWIFLIFLCFHARVITKASENTACEEVVCGQRCLYVILQAISYTVISTAPRRRNIVAAGKDNVCVGLLPLHLPGRTAEEHN